MDEKKEHEHHIEHKHHEHANHKPGKSNSENIFIGLVVVLAVILLITNILTFGINSNIRKSFDEAKEKARPGRVELTLITNSRCTDCFDPSPIVERIKSQKVNVTKESTIEFNSAEGKELTGRHEIESVPAIILTGEIDKVSIEGLEKKNDVLLLSAEQPPFTNVKTGRVEGRVTLTHLKDSSCDKCFDLNNLINQLKSFGVKIIKEDVVEINSEKGKELINKYRITYAPTLILSKDASVYTFISEAWPRAGSKETDGSLVLRMQYPPYINTSTNTLQGLVNIIYLTDQSCSGCYDINIHKQILGAQNYGLHLDKEETIDISEAKGKELLIKYNITQVPTVILSKDTSVYPSSIGLKQFFSVERDGSWIFRNIGVAGAYKDLLRNEVVKPANENT